MSSLIAWILRAIPFGTIIMYGALGETLTEKSGNLNLGVPGIMYLGGFAGFASAYYYEKLSANPSAFVCVILALLCALIASRAGRSDLCVFDHYPARQPERDGPCTDHFWHGRGKLFWCVYPERRQLHRGTAGL